MTPEKLSILRMVATRARLAILELLTAPRHKQGLPVQAIAIRITMTHSAVSHQLAALECAEIVQATRKGRYQIYTLSDTPDAKIVRKILRAIK